MNKGFLLFFLLFYSLPSWAQVQEEAEKKYQEAIRNMVGSFWGDYITKMDQMLSNFDMESSNTKVVFKNATGGAKVCGNSQIQEVGKVTFTETRGKLQTLRINTYGCDGVLVFTELLQVESAETVDFEIPKLILGQRDPVLKEQEKRRIWSVKSGEGLDIIKFTSLRHKKFIETTIKAYGETSIKVSVRDFVQSKKKFSRITQLAKKISSMNFSFKGQSNFNRYSSNYGGNFETLEDYYGKNASKYFIIFGRKSQYSQSQYNQFLSQFVLSFLDRGVKPAINFLNGFLPVTKAAAPTVGANARLIDELNLYIRKLPNDADFVEKRLLLLLNSIRNGEVLIQDNRAN